MHIHSLFSSCCLCTSDLPRKEMVYKILPVPRRCQHNSVVKSRGRNNLLELKPNTHSTNQMLLESLKVLKRFQQIWKGLYLQPHHWSHCRFLCLGRVGSILLPEGVSHSGWREGIHLSHNHTAAVHQNSSTPLYHQLLLPNPLQQTRTHPVQHHLHSHDSTKSPQNESNNNFPSLCSHCLFHVSLAVYWKG